MTWTRLPWEETGAETLIGIGKFSEKSCLSSRMEKGVVIETQSALLAAVEEYVGSEDSS